jgi:glycosyltransferase involved in cell wall biosynthesis
MIEVQSVLVCTDVTSRGGVDVHVKDLIVAYRRRGARVVVGLDRRMEPIIGRCLSAAGAEVRSADLAAAARSDGSAEAAYREMVEQVAPDLVHMVRGSHRSGYPIVGAIGPSGARLVVTEQYIPDDTRLGAEHRAQVSALYQRASAIVFVSEANRATMASSLDPGETPWVVIPNAVDLAAIEVRATSGEERRRRLDRRPVQIFTAARFTAQKGLDVLIEAVALLPPGLASVAIHGEGPDEGDLRALAAAMAPDRVTFHPWCPDVVGALAACDLFVLPSRNEGMPFTLLEAMAAGTPVVAARAPGVTEALGDGGLIVARGSADELAAAIVEAVTQPDLTVARAAIALRRARRHHALDRAMAITMALALDASGGVER